MAAAATSSSPSSWNDFSSLSVSALKQRLRFQTGVTSNDLAGAVEKADLVALLQEKRTATAKGLLQQANGPHRANIALAASDWAAYADDDDDDRSPVAQCITWISPAPQRAAAAEGEELPLADVLVVVLHGFGANAQDLAPLSQQLVQQRGLLPVDKRVAFVHINAIVDMGGGSRAWWMINMQELMSHVMANDAKSLFITPPKGLNQARSAVLEVIELMRSVTKLPVDKVVLAGFSQGAMLATDVSLTLARDEGLVGALSVWSGVAIARDEWAEKVAAFKAREGEEHRKLLVVQSHGTQDPILPYVLGDELRRWLEAQAGADVEFISFAGGHTIGGNTLARFADLVSRVADGAI